MTLVNYIIAFPDFGSLIKVFNTYKNYLFKVSSDTTIFNLGWKFLERNKTGVFYVQKQIQLFSQIVLHPKLVDLPYVFITRYVRKKCFF